MQNKPFHSAFDADSSGAGSFTDPVASGRILILKTIFGIAALIVLARLVWVQTQLQDRYLDALSTITVEYETIPARDGRVLTESSEVLAVDVDQHRLQIHYRWLQDPIDESWLNRQVRSRLTRTERRDDELVQQVTAEIKQERLQLWKNVILATGVAPDEFRRQQTHIQSQVKRIADSVNERRQHQKQPPSKADADDGVLMKWATAVRDALTQAPERAKLSRITVREEESFHDLLDDVPLSVVALVEEQSHRFPGVRVVTDSRRTYPQPTMAPHVVGARRQTTEDSGNQADSKQDAAQQSQALFGVERSYDHVLQGIDGRRKITRNRRYQILKTEVVREAVAGRDITLTIDAELQRKAQQLLDDALQGVLPTGDQKEDSSEPRSIPLGGCVLVSEVQTGRIVVAASAPSFPLTLFTGASQEQWDLVNQDRRKPFLFRATQMEIPPGSAVKPLTAVAGIASGFLNPMTPFHCQGYLNQPDQRRCLIYRLYGQSHGDIRLSEAIAQSCNVYFFDVARRMGSQNLLTWFDRMGLGRRTGIDLPAERSGQLPKVSTSSANEQTAMGTAIGQNRLTVTPLQIHTAIAAIANGGFVVTPHVVSETGAARLDRAVDAAPRQRTRTALPLRDPDVLQFVREGMTATVQSATGTGYRTARLDDVSIAGKSGTAQTSAGKNDHAWFVGFVPAEQPKYAFTVVLEHGGSGSKVAGPIAREVVRALRNGGML